MVKAITSFFLIFIVLIGAVGVNFDSHYCGGVLVDQQFSFIPSDLSCGMSENGVDLNASKKSESHFSQVCCSNEHLGFQISDDYTDYQVSVFQFIPSTSFPEIALNYISHDEAQEYSFIGYSPPPIVQDILLVKESFLI